MYTDYVFGYASLANVEELLLFLGRGGLRRGDAFFCRLRGYRRTWNIAMNNLGNIPGYRYYVDATTGERLPVYVTFLNVRPAASESIGGMLFGVSPEELGKVDRRERNYQRIAVDGAITHEVQGRVWVYQGLPAAEACFQEGLSSGQAVINRTYYTSVIRAFRDRGEAALSDFFATTDRIDLPMRALEPRRVADRPES